MRDLNRRHFLGGSSLALGALPVLSGAGLTLGGPPASAAEGSAAIRRALTSPLTANPVDGHRRLCDVTLDGTAWSVWEDQSGREGAITFLSGAGQLRLTKRIEPTFATTEPPYLGLALKDIAQADADLLADRLLAHGGDPDPTQVRAAAPPAASRFKAEEIGARLPWTNFVGTKQASDTMPVMRNGRTRTFRPEHVFPELRGDDAAGRRWEGMLLGWLPAAHKIIEIAEDRYYDLLVFADVEATDPFVAQTWHRTVLYDKGQPVKTAYGHSYAPFPPRRQAPPETDFFSALLKFAAFWQHEVRDAARLSLPDPSWPDMVKHAFVRELITRPQGRYPKYGAVDRDYYGSEYDGFQDTFTSSLYANLEWGRFDQAKIVLDEYFDDFVFDDGMINMRGPEVAQFGLTLSLIARYFSYTGDIATLKRLKGKIRATADILVELHEAGLRLAPADPGHGLLQGWSESDSCLHPDPGLWWKSYWNNSAFAVRGWRDLAAMWTSIAPEDTDFATSLRRRADGLQAGLVTSLRANVLHDLTPPYIGIMPGVKQTFRQAMAEAEAASRPSEQGWAHRAYAELLQADVLPEDLSNLIIDCLRGHGGTTIGVVANFVPANDEDREQLGFISYGYAQALLRNDRIEEYLLFLYSHRYHSHLPGNWLAAETCGIDGGLPLYCVPAQLTIPKLLRWMMVFEESDRDRLHLLRAVPRDWLATGQRIALAGAPTRWGAVDVALTIDMAGRTAEAQIGFSGRARPAETHLRLRLPKGHKLVSATLAGKPVTLGGREHDTLIVPPFPEASASLSIHFA